MNILANKVAVITGASRGLREAIARAFVRKGELVVLAGRSIEVSMHSQPHFESNMHKLRSY